MSTTYTERTKPSTSWTERTKPSTIWAERSENVLLTEDGFYLLQENNNLILLENSAPISTSWTERTKI
jgi:hypothetical protein